MKITTDAWIAELERVLALPRLATDGVTVSELRDQTGWTPERIRAALRQIAGLEVGRKAFVGLDGRHTYVPCYRLAGAKAKRR